MTAAPCSACKTGGNVEFDPVVDAAGGEMAVTRSARENASR